MKWDDTLMRDLSTRLYQRYSWKSSYFKESIEGVQKENYQAYEEPFQLLNTSMKNPNEEVHVEVLEYRSY